VPITYKPAPAFNAIVSAIGPVALSPPLNTFVKMPAFVLGGQGSSTNQQQYNSRRIREVRTLPKHENPQRG
jgi:hypothetical protein